MARVQRPASCLRNQTAPSGFQVCHQETEVLRLLVVDSSKSRKYRCPTLRKRHDHDPTIRLALLRSDQPTLLRAFNETDDGMQLALQELCQFRNGCRATSRESSHTQHELMLLGSNTVRSCRIFAEAQELAQRITEMGEVDKRSFGVSRIPLSSPISQSCSCFHSHIIS